MASKKKAKKVEIDFSDEESVKLAMAQELDCDPGDLEIEEDRGLTSFGEGTAYAVTCGGKEYQVVENDDAAHNLAVAIVKQDLESEPEIFNHDFLQSHIDTERLARDLHSDVYEMEYESLNDEAKRRPMDFMKDNNIDIPEPTDRQLREYAEAMSDDDNSVESILKKLAEGDAEDRWIEMGEEPEVPDRAVEELVEDAVKNRLSDPITYLTEMYGQEDGIKKAMEIGGIDIDAAADEAVSTDGEGHFLARYDGHMHDGPGGIVWWRSN